MVAANKNINPSSHNRNNPLNSKVLEIARNTMKCQRKLKVIHRNDLHYNRNNRTPQSRYSLISIQAIPQSLLRCIIKMVWARLSKTCKEKYTATKVFWRRVMLRKFKRTKISLTNKPNLLTQSHHLNTVNLQTMSNRLLIPE